MESAFSSTMIYFRRIVKQRGIHEHAHTGFMSFMIALYKAFLKI